MDSWLGAMRVASHPQPCRLSSHPAVHMWLKDALANHKRFEVTTFSYKPGLAFLCFEKK